MPWYLHSLQREREVGPGRGDTCLSAGKSEDKSPYGLALSNVEGFTPRWELSG